MASEPKPWISPIDDFPSSHETENRLNSIAAGIFSTGAGIEFLEYLRRITLSRGFEPSVPSSVLHWAEGTRWLTMVIIARVKQGQKGPQTHEPRQSLVSQYFHADEEP